MQNNVDIYMLHNYEDLLPIFGVPIGDLRKNHFKKKGNDKNKQASPKDLLEVKLDIDLCSLCILLRS